MAIVTDRAIIEHIGKLQSVRQDMTRELTAAAQQLEGQHREILESALECGLTLGINLLAEQLMNASLSGAFSPAHNPTIARVIGRASDECDKIKASL